MPEAITRPPISQDKPAIFRWLLQRDVHEYMDMAGRPVGEGRSQAYAQVETVLKTCPYAGSRYQHPYPMNLSALQSITPEWQGVLAALGWLSQRYQAFHATPVATFYDLALVAGAGVFLADYLALRQEQALEPEGVPILVAGLYKVSLGFQQATFLAMMNDRFKVDPADKALPDAKGFYTWLEAEQLLIGEAEVCAGSEVMISKAYETMKARTSADKPAQPPAKLADMAVAWEQFDQFTFNTSNLWRKAILFVIQMQDFRIELHERSLPSGLADSINTYLHESFSQLLQAQSGLAVELARLTVAESGHSLDEWMTVQQAFLAEIGYQAPEHTATENALAEAMTQQLSKVFDLSSCQATVTYALSKQLASYAAFETAALQAFNEHLGQIQTALGCDTAGAHLTTHDLSGIYGKTLRDWPEFMNGWDARFDGLDY